MAAPAWQWPPQAVLMMPDSAVQLDSRWPSFSASEQRDFVSVAHAVLIQGAPAVPAQSRAPWWCLALAQGPGSLVLPGPL